LHAEDSLGLAVSNVNYSGISYPSALVVDPATDQSAGGEAAMAYGAGGQMCCYSLPTQWRPGIQVEVRLLMPTKAKNYEEYKNMPDVWQKKLVEIPPYQGRPGTLWIVIYPDQQVAVYATNDEPSSPNWPGKIKGWPVPSVEYRRMLWDRKMSDLQKEKKIYEAAIKKKPAEAQDFESAIDLVNQEIERIGARP